MRHCVFFRNMTREYGGPLLYIRAKFSQIIRMKYQNSEYNLQTSTDISKGKCTCYCLCGEVVWGTPMQSHSIPIPFSYFNSAPLITNSTQGSSQHSLQGSQLIWLHTCFVPVHQGKKKLVRKQPNGGICFFLKQRCIPHSFLCGIVCYFRGFPATMWGSLRWLFPGKSFVKIWHFGYLNTENRTLSTFRFDFRKKSIF